MTTHVRAFHLTTARLGLSRWTMEDLPLARRLWADADVMRLLGGPLSESAVEARLSLEISLDREYGLQYWPLFQREATAECAAGEFIGCAGLRPFPYPHPQDAHTYELGAHLLPAYWRSGYAAEAGRAILRHAFETLGATAVHTGHHPENTASEKVILASHFRYQAHRFYLPTGLMHPYYRMTSEEYRSVAAGWQATERAQR